MIFVKTGEGGDKTTSAMGVALRALGHCKRVVIIQLLKGRLTGEREALSKFPDCDFKQFGTEEFIDLRHPSASDKKRASDALAYARRALKSKPFLLILDEVNLACAFKLIKTSEVINFLREAKCHVILTGRRAPKSLQRAADFVTEYTDLKRLDREAEAGIEF